MSPKWPALVLLLCLTSFGADSPPQADLSIELTPEAERRERVELWAKASAGDGSARKAWKKLKQPARTEALGQVAIAHSDAQLRKHAIRQLGLMSEGDDPEAVGAAALARVAVVDSDGGMRELARQALVARGDTRAIKPLGTALQHADVLVRANAAAALKAIGAPKVFEVIIEHWREVWGPSARSHVFFGTSRSYVGDYDISGDAYDPVIRSVLTGVVLDTKVLRVEGDIYYIIIRELAPDEVNVDKNPAAWQKWLDKNKGHLAELADQKRDQAREELKKRNLE